MPFSVLELYCIQRYANRAKNIKNKPKINEDPKDALLREYQEEINRLKAMLRGEIPLEIEGTSPTVYVARFLLQVVFDHGFALL